MTVTLIAIGILLTLAGLGGLVWCILTARKIQKGEIPEERAHAVLSRLSAINMASLGGAALGLALLLLALLFR